MPNTTDTTSVSLNTINFDTIDTLDKFYTVSTPLGSINQAVGNNLYGINHQQVNNVIPENRDSYGYVFFTRPQLNLSDYNLSNNRHFYSITSTKINSIQSYVRHTLDPRLALPGVGDNYIAATGANLVDDLAAFIPVLSNNIKNMSGWPDVVLPTYTSKQGVRKEQTAMGDGTTDIFESFDIDATFRNTRDEPITMMMQTWLYYIAAVFEGVLNPYMDMVVENEIDYNTRIYRLVMDESKKIVKKIAAVGAAFPVNVPTGKMFDFDNSKKYNDQMKDINIRFKCVGAMYNDDILVQEFNNTSVIFNPDLQDVIDGGHQPTSRYDYLQGETLLNMFNHRGYPLIDTNTFELKWWIDKTSDTYADIITYLQENT